MQSETLAQEFARLVKEYHEGDDRTKPEAWNLLADYAVDNADAISRALSDKQAVEVKALEWVGDGDCYAFADVTHQSYSIALEEGKYWATWDMSLPPFDTLQATQAAAQADYEQCVRSALVDVPAVEPVAWRWKFDADADWHYGGKEPKGFRFGDPEIVETLYSSPPLSREGEDSAIKEIMRNIKTEAFQREAVPGVATKKDTIRGVALALTARLSKIERLCIRALAATRSGSAIKPSGGEP